MRGSRVRLPRGGFAGNPGDAVMLSSHRFHRVPSTCAGESMDGGLPSMPIVKQYLRALPYSEAGIPWRPCEATRPRRLGPSIRRADRRSPAREGALCNGPEIWRRWHTGASRLRRSTGSPLRSRRPSARRQLDVRGDQGAVAECDDFNEGAGDAGLARRGNHASRVPIRFQRDRSRRQKAASSRRLPRRALAHIVGYIRRRCTSEATCLSVHRRR